MPILASPIWKIKGKIIAALFAQMLTLGYTEASDVNNSYKSLQGALCPQSSDHDWDNPGTLKTIPQCSPLLMTQTPPQAPWSSSATLLWSLVTEFIVYLSYTPPPTSMTQRHLGHLMLSLPKSLQTPQGIQQTYQHHTEQRTPGCHSGPLPGLSLSIS